MAPLSASNQLAIAVKNRQRYFQRVQYCFDLIKNPSQQGDFLARCQMMDDTFAKFEGTNEQINQLNTQLSEDETAIDTINVTKSFEELYFRVKAHEASIKSATSEADRKQDVSVPPPPKVKLPTISVPIFEGDITTFPSWRSLYDELVHTSPYLSDIQRFSYLKSYLKGSALSCVETIAFTAANYQLAYKSLVDRYAKKRTLASTYMNRLLEFQPLTKDSIGGLRSFLDGFYVVVESIKSLCINNLDEFMLVHLALKMLDSKTSMEFEREIVNKTEFPTFRELVRFVQDKANVLEQSAESFSQTTAIKSKPQHNPKAFVATNIEKKIIPAGKSSSSCFVCHQDFHKISACPKFKGFDPSKRFSVIKEMKLCFSCFSSLHSSSTCTSKYQCRECGSTSHHSLLHPSKNVNQPDPSSSKTAVSGVAQAYANILLGTAIVQVQDFMGNWISARCVIDPGSQISAVSENLAQALKLPRQACSMEVSGIGSANTVKAKGEILCSVLPHSQLSVRAVSEPLLVHSVILPRIASELSTEVPASLLRDFAHLQLADLSYVNQKVSSSIDMLIGAEYYANIIVSSLPIIQGSPAAIPSRFGWLLMGRVKEDDHVPKKCTSLFVSNFEDPVETQLQRFWEIENLPETPRSNPQDEECENHFVQTCTRDQTGRYIVSLPFKDNKEPSLGSNRDVALKRLNSLDKRLEKKPDLKTLYEENLLTYVKKGHMVVTTNPSPYLLVHHGVHKESSTTTKLRVVFDPNVLGSNGLSLARSLLVGPKLQSDIGDLLINFRLNVVALTCDIEGMYRSIWVAESDRKYQHILWHDEHTPSNVVEYELTTVTFGLPSSPYQAQRVLKQLVVDEGEKYPCAAPVVENDIYVDDVVTGANSVQEAIVVRDQLISLLNAGGFALRKWASSHPEILTDLPSELCEIPQSLGSSEPIKVLGLRWCPKQDSFCYLVKNEFPSSIVTKRSVLSLIASIYDVNGFLSPVIVLMKIFLQQLWLNKEDTWDTPLPNHLQEKWCRIMIELPVLSSISIPRNIPISGSYSIQLIGFADASADAYAAVVYLRVVSTFGVQIQLLRAKTKVAPLKVLTIPKLELCAAHLLAQTVKSVAFLHSKVRIDQTFYFSDSSTVLSWLRTQPHLLKTFVANRVVKILETSNPAQWRHVVSGFNSADPASRGQLASDFVKNKLWFNGPDFLYEDPSSWPQPVLSKLDKIPELKSSTALLLKKDDNRILQFCEKYSSLGKLKRVIAYVLRFIYNSKNPNRKLTNHLSVIEHRNALDVCIKVTQTFYLRNEIQAAKCGRDCTQSLRALSPIWLSSGILAVGGRLAHAPIPEAAKHPILIPKESHLAKLLILHHHILTLHGGPRIVHALLQQQYWVIGARNLIRSLLSKCVQCAKRKPTFRQPIMADLPASRYAQGRPFLNVGVDFAGPFTIKTGPRRNSPLAKCYFAVFVCMSTKCIHLELVSALTTPAFLAALDRFIGRRGLPTCIFSDNGTNFQGAAAYLSEVQAFLRSFEDDILQFLQSKEVKWNFIPPNAPNFGGLWEAGVRSVKKHLSHVLNGQAWNFEELSTFLVRVEAILNSRPICAINLNPNDGVSYLSPGHFLIGAPLLAKPEHDLSETPMSHLHRWQLLTHIIQCFWKKWSKDYLNTQILRSKWTKTSENVKVGDIVMVQGQNLPSQKWPLGIVTKVMPGADGIIRVISVKTVKGEFTRPVSKVAVLPLSDQFVHNQ